MPNEPIPLLLAKRYKTYTAIRVFRVNLMYHFLHFSATQSQSKVLYIPL